MCTRLGKARIWIGASHRISIKRLKERRAALLAAENRALRTKNARIRKELSASKERVITLTIETELLSSKLDDSKRARRRLMNERVQLKREKGDESGKALELSFRTKTEVLRLQNELGTKQRELETATEEIKVLTTKNKSLMSNTMERVLKDTMSRYDGPQPPVEMPKCEICCREYGEELSRIAKVLHCGHTVCSGCCGNCVKGGSIECPFDRSVTELCEHGIACIPKNFTVMSMITRRSEH